MYVIIIMSGGDSPKRQKISPVSQTGERKEANRMKFQNGLWWYKGKSYPTLRAALEAVWPKK